MFFLLCFTIVFYLSFNVKLSKLGLIVIGLQVKYISRLHFEKKLLFLVGMFELLLKTK